MCEYGSHKLTVLNRNTVANSTIKILPNLKDVHQFNCPTGIALAPDGHTMYVTDNHRVLKMTIDGELIHYVGGTVHGNNHLEFNYPQDIVIHPTSSQLYVADTDNKRIQVLNQDLTFSDLFTGNEEKVLVSPSSLAFDSDLNLYIADCGLHCILKVTGNAVIQISMYGKNPGQLNLPMSLAIDSTNLIYVAEQGNQRISIFDTKGTFKHCFGGEGGKIKFDQLKGVVVDSDGYLYVSDFYNNRLLFLS